jgi:hypothetical protein
VRAALLLALAALAGDSAPAAYQAVHFLPDPESRVVAVALRFPAGAAEDPVGQEGRAHLFGRVLQRAATDPLIGHGAQVMVEVGTEETVVVLLAAPDSWREALLELEALLYTRVPTQAEVDAARAEAAQVLQFEEGAPVRGFERERAVLLLGPTHPAARPAVGTVGTIVGLQPSDLAAFRTEHLRRGSGVAALTGPVDRAEVEAAFQSSVSLVTLGRSPLPRPLPVPPDAAGAAVAPVSGADGAATLLPPPVLRAHGVGLPPLRVPATATGAPAWSTPERVVLDRSLTSTWMAIAFPFPPGSPGFLLDFLAHLVIENLIRTPPDPGLFEADVSVERIRDAPVVVISASVDPFRAEEWEGRLRSAFDSLASAPPEGAFFELTRRRFRSRVLLDLAVPENLVRWIVREASLGRVPLADPEVELWRLEREGVAEAARAAGPPRSVLYGPQGLTGR